jgi:hypothetical protein
VIISAGQGHWYNGQRAEASELFLDVAHMINLLYRDEGRTPISVLIAQRAALALVSTLQRLIAETTHPDELEQLARSADKLSAPRHTVLATAFQNDLLFSRLAFLSQIHTPFSNRVSNAIAFYNWWADDCHAEQDQQNSFCGGASYDALAYMFPRFYYHWQTVDRYLVDQHAKHLEMLAASCSPPHHFTPPHSGSRRWSDYITPDSAMARAQNQDEFAHHLIVNHCLADFFVNSLQIALALKKHELARGQPARSLGEVLSEVPRDPFSLAPIGYDWEHQLLWSAGTDGQGERGYPGAPPPSEYTAESAFSAHPTYLLRPRPIPAPEKRPSRCEQDPSIPPLDDIESGQGKNEPTQAH